jgi:hypothetical protein
MQTILFEDTYFAGLEQYSDLYFPLEQSLTTAASWLEDFLSSDDFVPKIQLAFGDTVDGNEAKLLIQQLAQTDPDVLPKIEIRSSAEINGANGAYAAATDTIYLSQDFLDRNAGNIEPIVSVLLEEMGHSVDARLNCLDSSGDEGAIFSALVRGETLSSSQLSTLKGEDDTATLQLDGQGIQIEQANAPTKFWDDPQNFAAWAEIPDGVGEPAVPIFSQGVLVGNYKVVELFDKTPDGLGYPGTFADTVANTYVRATYQKPDGTAGQYGTSFAATFWYRPAAVNPDFSSVPTVDRAEITMGGVDRYTDVLTGHFGSVANVTSTRTFPDPTFAFTTVGVSNTLAVQQDVELATGYVGTVGDVLRAGTLSSMFSSSQEFDASLILWEDKAGNVHSLQLSDATPRDKHLFDEPQELGSWVELVKEPGSTWYPDSPTIRLVISDPHGLQLGLQGFLASTQNPNDDSLSVWTEVLNPPSTLAQGTNYKVDFEVIAVAPTLNTPIYRFQNTSVPGTYLYAGAEEATSIRQNYKNFTEEGLAFKVATSPSDPLLPGQNDPLLQPLYRFQNTSVPGTYLYAGAEEAASIRQNYQNFTEEGLAFYVYGVGSEKGTIFERFQNTSLPGTYLYAGPSETQSILANYPNFHLEGAAFEVGG